MSLAFRLIVSRADRDEEFRDFLTDAGVTVTDVDGTILWPKEAGREAEQPRSWQSGTRNLPAI